MPDLSPFSRSRAPATFAGRDLCVSETRHEEKLLLAGDLQVLAPLLEARLLPAPDANSASMNRDETLLWLSPRQWLLLTTLAMAKRTCEAVVAMGASGSCSTHDVGARFVGLTIEGAHAGELLAAGCSLDFRERHFRVGCSALTRIEQAPVILFRKATAQYEVMVERPLAQYLWRWVQEMACDGSNRELTC